jgi:hypothetical protein
MLIILDTWEVEIRKIMGGSQLRQKAGDPI